MGAIEGYSLISTPSSPDFVCRALESEQDWWRVRGLLIETFPITGPGFNWELRHWEGNRFHCELCGWNPQVYAEHQLWETAGGRRVGVAHHEGAEHWADCQRMVDLLNAAFNRPNFHQPGEYHNFMTQAPMFLNELNLVMAVPDGSFAAHAALNFDTANRYAIFEPVCTHPDPRQRGLAKALMLEGLRRARELGAQIVEVSTGDGDAANALYDSIGFTEYYQAYAWKKVW